MQLRLPFTLLIPAVLAAAPTFSFAAPRGTDPAVLVIVDAGTATNRAGAPGMALRSPELAGVMAIAGVESVEPLLRRTRNRGSLQVLRLTGGPSFAPADASRRLRASGRVRAAMVDVPMRPMIAAACLDTLPDDPDRPLQWWVDAYPPEGIHLRSAWCITHGSPSIRIGIADTGVDLGHPDLASKIAINPAEIPDNSLDDDANGYVDDVTGWDAGDNDNDPNPEPFFEPQLGIDESFHGTFVAGMAAAATGNADGISGAGWDCRIVPIRVASGDVINSSSLVMAFDYAIAAGVDILNLSLGAPGDSVGEFFQPLVDDAIAAGILVIASAGNDGTSALNFPAACNGVLSVAATDETGARASFSNWGPTVDLAAPGATMWGAINRNYVHDEWTQIVFLYFFGWDGESPYMYGDGTSFAAPLVSGVAGLVRAQFPDLTPGATAIHMVAKGDAVGFDHPIGPLVNAYRSVVSSPLGVDTAPGFALSMPVPNPARGAVSLMLTLPQDVPVIAEVIDVGGRRVQSLGGGTWAAGVHRITWDGAGRDGRRAAPGLYFVRVKTAKGTLVRRLVVRD
jgi:subtilisin family serine protease